MVRIPPLRAVAVAACILVPVVAAAGDVSPLVVPAAAFRADATDTENYCFEDYGYIRGRGSTVRLFAPVYLPDGAQVTSLEAYVIDPTDACSQGQIRVYLERTSNTGAIDPTAMALVRSEHNSLDVQPLEDDTIAAGSVDNDNYHYYLHASLCSTLHYLLAVRIHYVD